MLSLLELQEAFASAILDKSIDLEPYVIASGVEPSARLSIYRNNVRANILAALRASFPVLERLVGTDYFRQLAFDYARRFPSSSGNLQHAGGRLPEYLERRYAATKYAYFSDVARLEWGYQEVLVAEDHATLDLGRLGEVTREAYATLRFRIHPAARLVASAFPILEIWSANQPGADSQHIIDLARGGQRVLLHRTADAVVMAALTPAEFILLRAIADGETLERAAATGAGAEFDLGQALRRFVGAGVIVDFCTGSAICERPDLEK